MAIFIFRGDASVTQQVDTFTIAATWAASDTIAIRITDLNANGVFQDESFVAAGSDKETIRDAFLAVLVASTQSLFAAISFAASGTDKITLSNKINGRPQLSANTGTVTAGSGTWTHAATTANSGPHDFNTAGNWDDQAGGAAGEVPGASASADVNFSDCDVDLLYGLDQSAAANVLTSLTRHPSHTGSIGDPTNGYFLHIDAADVKINGKRGKPTYFNAVSIPTLTVVGNVGHSKFKGTVVTFRIGGEAGGTVELLDSATVTTFINSSAAYVICGKSITGLVTVLNTRGRLLTKSNMTNLLVSGGHVISEQGNISGTGGIAGANPGVKIEGGVCELRGVAVYSLVTTTGGLTKIGSPEGPHTSATKAHPVVSNMTIEDGVVEQVSEVTFSAAINQHSAGLFKPFWRQSFTPASL